MDYDVCNWTVRMRSTLVKCSYDSVARYNSNVIMQLRCPIGRAIVTFYSGVFEVAIPV